MIVHTIHKATMKISILTSLVMLSSQTQAYSIGDVNPRALQGVWRLTSLDKDGLPFEKRRSLLSSDPETIWKSRGFMPMKEFTTYPKKKLVLPTKKQTELFIKLKDDMTFEQCSSMLYDDKEMSMEEMLESDLARRERESFAMKGTWDFVDGKLILASDRPEKKPFSAYDEDVQWPTADTILVGKVSVDFEKSSEVNADVQPMTDEAEQDIGSKRKQSSIDVHLSVPKGKIKTGKFMYPKHHPSFFEQPIFNPQSTGRFELKQVQGDHKVDDEDDLVELFRKEDLAGKKYYLSTFPLAERKKKDRNGRVIEEADEAEEMAKLAENVQVVGIQLFANNTFSTLRGLGFTEVRRGKWSIIGEKRDQVWIRVYRFGFGRSVSYGTYSEGMSLTQDDERTYWGKITEAGKITKRGDNDTDDKVTKKVEIDGAIMLGTGLEPCSIGRFRMVEMKEGFVNEEDQLRWDGSYVSMSPDDVAMNAKRFEMLLDDTNDGDQQSRFDFTEGAFE